MRTNRHVVRRTVLAASLVGALSAAAIASAAGGTGVGTHSTKKGKVLANSHGYSLYMFQKDKQGGKSTCYGQCAVVWPPLLSTGKPVALRGSGVNSKLLGTVKRRDGKLEVTYNGWPLYLYQPDRKPGQINGEGANQFGAPWYLLNTSGKLVKSCPPGYVMSSSGCVPGSY
jgi:predicted lipoprotein with Yx(FWY)xxD motif